MGRKSSEMQLFSTFTWGNLTSLTSLSAGMSPPPTPPLPHDSLLCSAILVPDKGAQNVIRCWRWRRWSPVINFPAGLATEPQNLFLSFSIRFKNLAPFSSWWFCCRGLRSYRYPGLISGLSLQPHCRKISSAPSCHLLIFFLLLAEMEHKLRLSWYCGSVNHVPPEDCGGWIKVKQVPFKPLLLQSNYIGERKEGKTH